MRAQHVFLGLGLLLALGANGCGDDSTPSNEPSTTGGTSGTGAGGSSGSGSAGEAGKSGSSGSGGTAAGACIGQETQVETVYKGPEYTGTPSEIASQCTKAECLSSADPAACARDCVLRETNNAVTAECASCFGPVVTCGIANCMAVCVADPDAPICYACLCNKEFEGENSNKNDEHCIAPYESCSGLKSTKCQ